MANFCWLDFQFSRLHDKKCHRFSYENARYRRQSRYLFQNSKCRNLLYNRTENASDVGTNIASPEYDTFSSELSHYDSTIGSYSYEKKLVLQGSLVGFEDKDFAVGIKKKSGSIANSATRHALSFANEKR